MSYPVSLEVSLQSRANASKAFRRAYDEEAAAGADSSLWNVLSDHIRSTMFRYIKSQNDIRFFEWDAHDIWYKYILLAKNIDAEHPAQDRLACMVLWARELGVLSRPMQHSQISTATELENHNVVMEEAVTSDGRIWIDLPFLVEELYSAWANSISYSTNLSHRHNLSSAISRLVGLGVRDNALSGCGLSIMREALETPRATCGVLSKSSTEEASLNGLVADMTVMDFYPTLISWLNHAGHKLLNLSYSSCEIPSYGGVQILPGELAVAAGVNSIGFSRERFMFWAKRIEYLAQSDEYIVKDAFRRCQQLIEKIILEVNDITSVRTTENVPQIA